MVEVVEQRSADFTLRADGARPRHLDTPRYPQWEIFLELILRDLYNFAGNPLVCDCEMRWYKRWYNDGWQVRVRIFFALQQMVNVQDYRLFDNFSMTKSNLCYNIDLLTYDCIIAGLLNLFICWYPSRWRLNYNWEITFNILYFLPFLKNALKKIKIIIGFKMLSPECRRGPYQEHNLYRSDRPPRTSHP